MAGIESRKEKRAAVSRVSPANSPPMMVEPERLAPGISDKHLRAADRQRVPHAQLLHLRSRLPDHFGDEQRQTATTIIIVAITHRFFVNVPSICFLKSRPTMPMGIEPMITSQPSHASCESRALAVVVTSSPLRSACRAGARRDRATKARVMFQMSRAK